MITQLIVADSDPWLRDRCRDYFADRGYQVEVAANGVECLGALRRFPPDILVLQRELLWGDGECVLAVVREDQLRWPQAVILTTMDCAGATPRLEPPVQAVLRRPFCMAELAEAIRRAQYGETQLAARFLQHAQGIAAVEFLRRSG